MALPLKKCRKKTKKIGHLLYQGSFQVFLEEGVFPPQRTRQPVKPFIWILPMQPFQGNGVWLLLDSLRLRDYFKVPERLRYDLERLYPDAQSLENLVRNIKASAESMFYDEQARGVSFKTDKTVNVCQQFYLTRLCNRPENRFSKNDLPLLVRLLPAVKEFDQRPLLLPLMGSIAHVFVAEMAELHDLSREELDVMRKKDSSPEQRKLGDILAYRIAYLCADSTSEEVLKTILATPEIINHIGPSCLRFRQEQIKKMKKFSDLVGDGILPRVRVTGKPVRCVECSCV